jgi:ADP-heptose:LPS heptosyltransferase
MGRRLNLLRTNQYDTAFILRKSFTMALLCHFAGIHTLVGYDKQRFFKPLGYKRWGWLLNYQAPYPSLKTEIPQPISHLSLLKSIGAQVQDTHLELWSTPQDDEHLAEILQERNVQLNMPIAVIHMVSASHGKSFEPEKFESAIRYLVQNGFQVMCTGAPQDAFQYDLLASSTGLPLINLAGKTSLRETYALYKKAQLILTVDSSPIHLAAAAGIPKIVGVFGPTNEKQWGPYASKSQFQPVYIDLPCRPCYAKICEHNSCRTTLTETHVLQGIQKILNS